MARIARMEALTLTYLGNFGPSHSTESHVAADLESLGHRVVRIQEGQTKALDVPLIVADHRADVFLHTQTYSLAHEGGTPDERRFMLDNIKAQGIPTVGFHLDRWFGLDREGQVREDPFFAVQHLFTADGGHQAEWEALGINHHWMPPGVFSGECYDAPPHSSFRSDVAFVGSWQGYGHAEWWPYRHELLERLRGWYGRRFVCWPKPNRRAVRGHQLNVLYASCKVAVGDSCLSGGIGRYWSDRTPETLGRGGFIIHPDVEGYSEVHPYVPTWPLGDWDALHELIELHLADAEHRDHLRREAAIDVRANHTYAARMREVLRIVFDKEVDGGKGSALQQDGVVQTAGTSDVVVVVSDGGRDSRVRDLEAVDGPDLGLPTDADQRLELPNKDVPAEGVSDSGTSDAVAGNGLHRAAAITSGGDDGQTVVDGPPEGASADEKGAASMPVPGGRP